MMLRVEEPAAPSLHDERYDETDVATASTQTFQRLRALVGAGYTPQFDMSDDKCLLLSHPRKSFKYRAMLLDSSGAVWWRYDQDYKMHFARWEKKRFDAFLRSVPEPNWWDRTRVYRENVCVFVIGATVCAILYTGASATLPLAVAMLGWE